MHHAITMNGSTIRSNLRLKGSDTVIEIVSNGSSHSIAMNAASIQGRRRVV
jgi:hypothetical protein